MKGELEKKLEGFHILIPKTKHTYVMKKQVLAMIEEAKKDLGSMFNPTDNTYVIPKEKFVKWFGEGEG